MLQAHKMAIYPMPIYANGSMRSWVLGEDEERDIIQFLTRTKVFNKERLRQAPAAIAPPGGKLAAKRLLSWVEPTLLLE